MGMNAESSLRSRCTRDDFFSQVFNMKELMKPRTAAFHEKIREENYAELLAKAIVKVKKMKEEEEKLKRKQSLDEEEEDEDEEGGRNCSRDHSFSTYVEFFEKLTFVTR